MLRFKIYWFFKVILVISIVFLIFQVFFYENLRQVFSHTEKTAENLLLTEGKIKNAIRGREVMRQSLEENTKIYHDTSSSMKKNKVKVKKIKVPVDTNREPLIGFMLPFNHRLNFKNFSIVFVEEFASVNKINAQIVVNSSSQRNKIKGIDKNLWYLYEPDPDGLFQCTNSDVNLLYFFKHLFLSTSYLPVLKIKTFL